MSLALSGYRVTQTKVKCRHRPMTRSMRNCTRNSQPGTRAGDGSRRTGIARSEADDVMIVMMINKRSDR